jgi:hypothetical protein
MFDVGGEPDFVSHAMDVTRHKSDVINENILMPTSMVDIGLNVEQLCSCL